MDNKYSSNNRTLGKRIKRGLVTTVGATCVVTGAISFLFGFEPQIDYRSRVNNKPMENFTLKEYVESSREANGNNLLVDTLSHIAYPGAKLGRLASNSMVN